MSGKAKAYDQAHINARVGERLKMLRLARGVKQLELATALGVTFQQIQKYESGLVPWTLDRLLVVSDFFDVPLDVFMLPNATEGAPLQPANRLRERRLQKGLTLKQVGAFVGASYQYVRILETGVAQLSVGWLMRLAAALGCHPWAVIDPMGGDDPGDEALLQQIRAMSSEQRQRIIRALTD